LTTTRQLGKYEIQERLGRGGTAEVYKAYQPSLDRHVAVKLLHPFLADDPEFKDRFEREARNVARLRHPNIVQVYDFEFDPPSETYYMVMELIGGQSIKQRLDSTTERFPEAEIYRLMSGAVSALAYAHARGMIHRDVKPANLMLDVDGRVVLTDFGIAKIVTGIQFTASGGMIGTPAYMAPEQGLGEAGDERSDLYSLGIIMYQMLTGVLPYDAESPLAVILKHHNESTPSVRTRAPDASERIAAITYKAMQKEPENRFQSADEMLKALEDPTVVVPPAPPPGKSGPPSSKITLAGSEPPPPVMPTTMPLDATDKPRRRLAGCGGLLIAGIAVLALGLTGFASGVIPGILRGTNTPTATATAPATQTALPSATATVTASQTATETALPTSTATATATSTATLPPTETASSTPTATPSDTPTITLTPSDTPTATDTATDTATPTFTPSSTPTASLTLTFTPTSTFTATPSMTPTLTPLPTITPSPTPNFTATLAAATNAALYLTVTAQAGTLAAINQTQFALVTPTPNYTATALLCRSQYSVVRQTTPDRDPIRANTDFERVVTLRNTGDCDWLPGMYLKYRSGEAFDAPLKIVMENTDPIPPGGEARFTFRGHTPRKGNTYSGLWEVRLSPDNKLLDPALTISFFAYE